MFDAHEKHIGYSWSYGQIIRFEVTHMGCFSLRKNHKDHPKINIDNDICGKSECEKSLFSCINLGFDQAFLALKKRDYESVYQIVQEYYCRCIPTAGSGEITKGFFGKAVYARFFHHDICWPDTIQVSDEDMKCYVILYCLYDLDAESAAHHISEKLGIEIGPAVLHKAMRTLKSIYEILMGKQMSGACEDGAGGLNIYYEVKSINDDEACENCEKMRGQTLWFDDAVIGVNYPPFDNCMSGYCRCRALIRIR